jgi:hypothetical protein
MRQHRHTRRWLGGALLVATLAILAGCGALKPARATPITDISLIAGDWAGTITEPYEPFYLKITPDRKLVAAWGVNYAWGTVTLRNGQATYEMQPKPLGGHHQTLPRRRPPHARPRRSLGLLQRPGAARG